MIDSRLLERGVTALPSRIGPGERVLAAVGRWNDLTAAIVLYRDPGDGDLLDDVYLYRDAPHSSSGSGLPEWVLDRPAGPLPDWRGRHLVSLGAQLAGVDGRWVAELTVMATRAVTTVEVRYGGAAITVAVPESGLVSLPGLVRSPDDTAEFRGFGPDGGLLSTVHYRPLTESDRAAGWPSPDLWKP
ncbi:hypothetical protein [Actinoplanes sp. NPDC049802]|uniref:hypothetical protein n=1 Tax=Actinoplanes sp. NPDC049802 TaxID=3154742 RepID=UPI003402F487